MTERIVLEKELVIGRDYKFELTCDRVISGTLLNYNKNWFLVLVFDTRYVIHAKFVVAISRRLKEEKP